MSAPEHGQLVAFFDQKIRFDLSTERLSVLAWFYADDGTGRIKVYLPRGRRPPHVRFKADEFHGFDSAAQVRAHARMVFHRLFFQLTQGDKDD